MSELGDSFRQWKEEAKERRGGRRKTCAEHLYKITDKIEEITAYHYRLFGKSDIYPTTMKFHNLIDQKRGRFHSIRKMEEYINDFVIDNNFKI